MNKLFLLLIVSVCFLFLDCEDYTDDFNFLNEEIERLTSENTDLKSLISDNTNAANQNAASSTALNELVNGLTNSLNTLELSLSTLTDSTSANQASTALLISEISALPAPEFCPK